MRCSGVDDVACALQQLLALGWFGIHGMQKQESPRGIPGGLRGRGVSGSGVWPAVFPRYALIGRVDLDRVEQGAAAFALAGSALHDRGAVARPRFRDLGVSTAFDALGLVAYAAFLSFCCFGKSHTRPL